MSLARVAGSRLLIQNTKNCGKRNSGGGGFWEQNNFENYGKQMAESGKNATASTDLWAKISMFVAIPVCVVFSYVCYKKEMDHLSHPRQPFVAYEHLRTRTNKYPWGDGNKTFFHNPVYNALPDGYEVPDPNEGKEHH